MMACGSLIIRVPATSSVCNSAIALGYPVTLAGEQYLYILLRKGILGERASQQTQGDDPQDPIEVLSKSSTRSNLILSEI